MILLEQTIKQVFQELKEMNIKENKRIIGGEYNEAFVYCWLRKILPRHAKITFVPKEDQIMFGDIRIELNGQVCYIEVKKCNYYKVNKILETSIIFDYKYYKIGGNKYTIQGNTGDYLGWIFTGKNVDYLICHDEKNNNLYVINKLPTVKKNMIIKTSDYISNCKRAKECSNYYDKLINIKLDDPNEFYFTSTNKWAAKEDNLRVDDYIKLARVEDYNKYSNKATKVTLGMGVLFKDNFTSVYGGECVCEHIDIAKRERLLTIEHQQRIMTLEELFKIKITPSRQTKSNLNP